MPGKKWLGKGRSGERGKVETHGDGVDFGRIDLDGSGIGDESVGREIELEGGAREEARTVASATVICMSMIIGRRERLVAIKNLDMEVSPEIMGPGDESRRAGT